MSHLKHPDKYWDKQLVDAGQPAFFGIKRKEERRRNRHNYNNFYRDLSKHNGDYDKDEDGEICYAVEKVDEPADCRREWREQSDNLSPLKNFLKTMVGRPWNEIHSKLSRRTNRRSTCGNHLWLHVRGYIEEHEWRIEWQKQVLASRIYHLYFIDEDGIFRGFQYGGRHYDESWKKVQRDSVRAENFLKTAPSESCKFGNISVKPKIVLHGLIPFWGVPVGTSTILDWKRRETIEAGSCRSGKRLSKEEAQTYWSFHEKVRKNITS